MGDRNGGRGERGTCKRGWKCRRWHCIVVIIDEEGETEGDYIGLAIELCEELSLGLP